MERQAWGMRRSRALCAQASHGQRARLVARAGNVGAVDTQMETENIQETASRRWSVEAGGVTFSNPPH